MNTAEASKSGDQFIDVPANFLAYWLKYHQGGYHVSIESIVEMIGVGFYFSQDKDIPKYIGKLRNSHFVVTKLKFLPIRKFKINNSCDIFYEIEKLICHDDDFIITLTQYLTDKSYLIRKTIKYTSRQIEEKAKDKIPVLFQIKTDDAQLTDSGQHLTRSQSSKDQVADNEMDQQNKQEISVPIISNPEISQINDVEYNEKAENPQSTSGKTISDNYASEIPVNDINPKENRGNNWGKSNHTVCEDLPSETGEKIDNTIRIDQEKRQELVDALRNDTAKNGVEYLKKLVFNQIAPIKPIDLYLTQKKAVDIFVFILIKNENNKLGFQGNKKQLSDWICNYFRRQLDGKLMNFDFDTVRNQLKTSREEKK